MAKPYKVLYRAMGMGKKVATISLRRIGVLNPKPETLLQGSIPECLNPVPVGLGCASAL